MKSHRVFAGAAWRAQRPPLLAICLVLIRPLIHAAEEPPYGLDHRIPWTTSRVVGSPDPPLPYSVEKTFTKIKWQSPIYATAEPHIDSLLIVQQGGEKDRPSRVLRVPDEPSTDQVETLLVVSNRLVYSVAFHPGYRTNGYLFVFSNGPTPEPNRTNRISRFTVERQAPHRCDPSSERTIIEWRSAGHDGGGIVFGHDGMLYISSGDGTSDSDTWVTGQDLSDLLGGVLRIDLEHVEGNQRYSIPKDNPFVGLKNARPELWAYGLRNPWRMTIDRKTGQIWVGVNGQDLWETAHLIRRGENYGWSVYEGSHPFYLNRKLGPTPPVLPTIEHSHSEARSLTGGIVYYGDELSELNGAFVFGEGVRQPDHSILAREVDLTRRLFNQKVVPEIEMLRLERQSSEMRGQLAKN
jgi:glucose/arabinose dehydrogenase